MRVDDEWYFGESRGKLGVFPGNYVERYVDPNAKPSSPSQSPTPNDTTTSATTDTDNVASGQAQEVQATNTNSAAHRLRPAMLAVDASIAVRRSSEKRRASLAAIITSSISSPDNDAARDASNSPRFDMWATMDGLVEEASAEKIQAVARGHRARMAALKGKVAAVVFQALWRGAVVRKKKDGDVTQPTASKIERDSNHEVVDAEESSSKDNESPTSDDLKVGDKVEADYGGQNAGFYPGTISAIHDDGTYDVLYDDGDKERRVVRNLIHKTGEAVDEDKVPEEEDNNSADSDDGESVTKVKEEPNTITTETESETNAASSADGHQGQTSDTEEDVAEEKNETKHDDSDNNNGDDNDTEFEFPEVEDFTPYQKLEKTIAAATTTSVAASKFRSMAVSTGKPTGPKATVADIVLRHQSMQKAVRAFYRGPLIGSNKTIAALQPLSVDSDKARAAKARAAQRSRDDFDHEKALANQRSRSQRMIRARTRSRSRSRTRSRSVSLSRRGGAYNNNSSSNDTSTMKPMGAWTPTAASLARQRPPRRQSGKKTKTPPPPESHGHGEVKIAWRPGGSPKHKQNVTMTTIAAQREEKQSQEEIASAAELAVLRNLAARTKRLERHHSLREQKLSDEARDRQTLLVDNRSRLVEIKKKMAKANFNRHYFSTYDIARVGYLDKPDFSHMMCSARFLLTEEEADLVFRVIDDQQSGFVTFSDIRTFIGPTGRTRRHHTTKKAKAAKSQRRKAKRKLLKKAEALKAQSWMADASAQEVDGDSIFTHVVEVSADGSRGFDCIQDVSVPFADTCMHCFMTSMRVNSDWTRSSWNVLGIFCCLGH